MSNYIVITDYEAKDNLLTGNPAKLIKGAEFTAEFNAIATAISTKADSLSPTLTTPSLGVATATSINKVTITAPATGSTLTVADGKTLTASNSLTLAGTDGTTLTFQGTDTYVGRATTDTLTNKTLTSPTINGTIATTGLTLPALTLGGTVTSNGQSFSGTIANLGTVTTADINGGTLDGVVIGGSSAAAATVTNLTYTGTLTGSTGVMNIGSGQIYKDASGNVGIGSASVGPKLDVSVTSGVAKIGAYSAAVAGQVFYGGAGNVAGTNTSGGVATVFAHSANANGNTSAAPWDGTTFSGAAGIIARGFSESGQYRGSLEFWTETASNPFRSLLLTHDGFVLSVAAGIGYGTGAGGTVTQATSKSTAVTLNTPTGKITMNNAALAAGATVTFALNNSLVATSDVVVATGVTHSDKYRIETYGLEAGLVAFRVTNITAGSLSDALEINFAIIKGATS